MWQQWQQFCEKQKSIECNLGPGPRVKFWGGSLEMCLRSDLVSGYFLDVILERIFGDGS